MNRSALSLLAFFAFSSQAFASDGWIGNFGKHSERAPSEPCEYSKPITNNEVDFDGWDATRALSTYLCFEVYVPGVTDQASVAPTKLDVYTQDEEKYPAEFITKKGNNFVYALNLKDFNPYQGGKSANGNTKMDLTVRIFANDAYTSRTRATSDEVTVHFGKL